jgi:hypothetical protein
MLNQHTTNKRKSHPANREKSLTSRKNTLTIHRDKTAAKRQKEKKKKNNTRENTKGESNDRCPKGIDQ